MNQSKVLGDGNSMIWRVFLSLSGWALFFDLGMVAGKISLFTTVYGEGILLSGMIAHSLDKLSGL